MDSKKEIGECMSCKKKNVEGIVTISEGNALLLFGKTYFTCLKCMKIIEELNKLPCTSFSFMENINKTK